MKRILFGLLCALPLAAEPLTFERLISSVETEPAVQAGEKKRKAIQSGTSLKLWNSLELQYKLDGFGFMEHDFELRFKPKVFGEGSSTEDYWNAQSSYQQSRANFYRSFLVYERYERALRYLTQKRKQQLHWDMAAVNKDRLEVLHLKSGSETFNPENLISALERESELQAELIADSNALRDIEMKFHSWIDFDSVALDTSFLPKISDIENLLKDPLLVDDTYSAVAMAKQKWNVESKQYEQEKTGSNKIISSIGIGYKHSFGSYEYDSVKTGTYSYDYENKVAVADKKWEITRKDDDRRTRDKFYATLTLRLPFFGTDGGDETKRQLDVLEAESDYLDEKRSITQKVARLREETLALIAQRNVQKNFVERVDAGDVFKEFAARSGSDPLLLLRARDVSLESEIKALQLEYEIYSRYLILLDYAGKLASPDISTHFKLEK